MHRKGKPDVLRSECFEDWHQMISNADYMNGCGVKIETASAKSNRIQTDDFAVFRPTSDSYEERQMGRGMLRALVLR